MIVRSLLTVLGFKTETTGLNKYNNLLKSTVGGARIVGKAIFNMGKAFLTGAGEMEQHQIAFETMFKSAEKASTLIKDIIKFAEATPFQVTGLVESSKQLAAYGFEAEEIIPMMTKLGNAASALGKDKLKPLVTTMGKVRVENKLTGKTTKSFYAAGIPIISELAKNFGVTNDEILKMRSAGKITFKDVEAAVTSLTTGNGRFAGLMVVQSKTFLGLITIIQDAITNIVNAIGKELLPEAKQMANAFLGFIESNKELIKLNIIKFFKGLFFVLGFLFEIIIQLSKKFKTAFTALSPSIQKVIKSVSKLIRVVLNLVFSIFPKADKESSNFENTLSALAVILNVVADVIDFVADAISFLTPVLKPLMIAYTAWVAIQWALNVAMNANPIGLIITAVGALVAGIILMIKNWGILVNAVKTGVMFIWNWFSYLLNNPFFIALGLIFLPMITIPALILKHWEPIETFFLFMWNEVLKPFGLFIGETFANLFISTANSVKDAWDTLTSFFTNLWTAIKTGNILEFLQSIIEFINDKLLGSFDSLKEKVNGAIDKLKKLFGFKEKDIEIKAVNEINSTGQNSKNNVNNVNTNIQLTFPANTSPEMVEAAKTDFRKIIKEENEKIWRGVPAAIPVGG